MLADLDMYFCTYGYPPAGWPSQDNKLYINDGTDYSWLKVQPLNDKGHPVLLGAEVRIFEAGTRTAISGARLVDGGSAFASQSSYDAYFGLNGVAASSFDVEMRRPAGTWVTKAENPELGNVKANSTLSAKC